jgi:hypothetical protein
MESFKEFYKLVQKNALPEHISTDPTDVLTQITMDLNSLSIEQRNQLSQGLSKYIKSDNFIDKLSDKIGVPKDDETKEEFVKRSVKALEELFDETF